MMGKPCIDCRALYVPRGPRQQRCGVCAAKHNRKMNAEYQRRHRARHRSAETAERIRRRGWQLDAIEYRSESLFADGMSASAAAEKLNCSHHTLLRWLDKPEVQRRIAFLRALDMPEVPC